MKKDLIVLSADSTAKTMLQEVLQRLPQVHSLRPFSWKVEVEKYRDPGCFNKGVEVLHYFIPKFSHCILIFDHEGSGAEKLSVTEIQESLEKKLYLRGWGENCAVIVIEPELENWVWTNSPRTSTAMGWGKDYSELQSWLIAEKWLAPNADKPSRPKEAMKAAVKKKLKAPISSSTFQSIAAKASFRTCTSPSFQKFKDTIINWYKIP